MTRPTSMRDAPPFASGTLPIRTRLGGLMLRVADAPAVWHERAQQRRLLAAADDRLLQDLGVGRGEVEAEWHKPFWRR
ncbi:MAG TPA: DUF1127 domain-containing protein [Alphaproteobacteria bacterium]|nr:DUF1127 domain-containing protein [Alphaproteobacteria bacterium]